MAMMEFCLLGPLVVRRDGAVVPVRPGKQRAVLAALLLGANQAVPMDELAEALWGSKPPPSAKVTIQNYVRRLRHALGDAGQRITTKPPGYLMLVAPDELDVSQFEALAESARDATRRDAWELAADRARTALALWHGDPLADIPSETLTLREVPRLAEVRLRTVETRIDADLHLGGHDADLVGELQRLIVAYPLREHLHALLMLALYRCGQQAGALAVYQRARLALIEEIGAEPGAELREVHRRILTDDPVLVAPIPAPATLAAPAPAVPRELPGTVRQFVGRDSELTALARQTDQAGRTSPGTMMISVIAGMPGVGKTALALQWAHRVGDRFPDGQLYVNLRGYDPGRPMPATDALAGFLRALGLPGQAIPVEEHERAARFRTLLAGRRMLVLLDNAGSADQVRPLLPGTPTCAVVVTSRDSLAGLTVRDGAWRLDLDVLSPAEAVGLLRALIGDRVDADPGAAALLAARCCLLPLALRVAAELAASRAEVPLTTLAGELANRRPLDLLEAGDDRQTAVRAVFSWSYRHLGPRDRRAFRLLGLHPGPDLDRYAAAALIGTTVGEVGHLLGLLARAYLVQPSRPGRYAMHDLLRAYAGELAIGEDGQDRARAALTRLFDHYLHAAATAMDALFPAERHRRPHVPVPASPPVPMRNRAEALAWLNAERASLVTMARRTADDWPGHTARLSATLARYLDDCGHFPEAILIHGRALEAARGMGDHVAGAAALTSLGLISSQQGRYRQAAGQLEQALALFRQAGDRPGEARALHGLGLIHADQGRHQQAAQLYGQSLTLFREGGDTFGEARVLGNLGAIERRLGSYERARSHYEQTLALCREIGDEAGAGQTLIRLGTLDSEQGRLQQAAGRFRLALSFFRETGERSGEATCLMHLGHIDLRKGRLQQAAGRFRRTLSTFREIGHRHGEARVLNCLGDVSSAAGQPADARRQYAAALGVASRADLKHEQARAHFGLARSYHAVGQIGQAGRHGAQALALYAEIGAPEADQLRAWLAIGDPEEGKDRVAHGEAGQIARSRPAQ